VPSVTGRRKLVAFASPTAKCPSPTPTAVQQPVGLLELVAHGHPRACARLRDLEQLEADQAVERAPSLVDLLHERRRHAAPL